MLVSHIRRTALVGTELENAEVGTIRLQLFRVAGLVLQPARRLVVSLSCHYPLQDVFCRVAMQLQTRPLAESSERRGNSSAATRRDFRTRVGAFHSQSTATAQNNKFRRRIEKSPSSNPQMKYPG